MAATNPRLVMLDVSGEPEAVRDMACYSRSATGCSRHPCEQCRCCACFKACTKCRDNCRPMEANLIPVVYCPDFVDFRGLRPVRYLYRSDYDCEYRLHLPGTR
jgi:hypothetical protein